jgi:hypothetical protein
MARPQVQPWHRWLLLGDAIVLAVTLSLGWWAVVFTADRRGWTNDGTLILAAAATVATASGAVGVMASSRGRHGLGGLGLLVAAVAAPTGFAIRSTWCCWSSRWPSSSSRDDRRSVG